MNEVTASSLAALPVDDQKLIVASARVTSFAHCAFLLANAAVSRLRATSVVLKVSFTGESSFLQIDDNGHFSKKFMDSLKAVFKLRVFATLEREVEREIEASFPSLKHVMCLAKSVHITWPVDADSSKGRSFLLKFKEGHLTAFEVVTHPNSGCQNSIAISGLFWNVPVRAKSFQAAEEWRCLSKMLEDLAICHSLVHFSIWDKSNIQTQQQPLLDFGPFSCRLDAFLSLRSLLERADFTPLRFFASSKDYSLNGYVSLKKLSEAHLHIPKILIINKVPIARSSSLYSTMDRLLSKFYLGGHESRTFSFVISFQIPQQEVSLDWQESAFEVQLKQLTAFHRFLKSSLSSFVKNCQKEGEGCEEKLVIEVPKRRSTFPRRQRSICNESDAFLSEDENPQSTNESEPDSIVEKTQNCPENRKRNPLPVYFKPPQMPFLTISDCAFPVESDFSISREDLRNLHLVGQFGDTVIVCVLENDAKKVKTLIGLDQHAAHERIRLDRLLSRQPKPVSFAGATTLSLQPSDVFAFDVVKWDRFGFSVTRENDSALIEAIPDVFIDIFDGDSVSKEKTQIISLASQTVVQALSNSSLYKGLYDVPAVIEAAKLSSCHGAIKAGTKLTREQCQGILEALAQCQDPFHCAHGRPSVIPIVRLPVL